MVLEPDRRWKVDRPAPVLYCRIYPNAGNRFCIAVTRTLRCRRNRCHEIRASPAKGKSQKHDTIQFNIFLVLMEISLKEREIVFSNVGFYEVFFFLQLITIPDGKMG